MKSTIGFGSFGWSGKWPAPSVTRTVIFPPGSVYRFSATRVWSLSHGSRPHSCAEIGAPALASGARLSIRLRLRHQAAHERIPGVGHRDLVRVCASRTSSPGRARWSSSRIRTPPRCRRGGAAGAGPLPGIARRRPRMVARGLGPVVNTGSDLAKQPEPSQMEYGVCRSGLLYLTKARAKQYAPGRAGEFRVAGTGLDEDVVASDASQCTDPARGL